MFGTPIRAFLLAVALLRPLAAQQGGTSALTLADAIALARSRHPALGVESARRQGTTAAALQESSFPNPVLAWRRENMGSPLSRDAFYTVAQPIDLTGRRLGLRAGARDVNRRALFDSASLTLDIEAGAARAFWRASLAGALLALSKDHRLDAERLARVEADRAREGAVAEVAAMRTSVEYDRARVAEAEAQADWTRAVADLARAVGVRPDSLPVVTPLAATISHIDAAPTSAAALAYAFDRRSELAALRAAGDAARHRVTAERRGVLSDVVVEGGMKQTAGYTTSVIGVAVPLPLFNRNAAARDRATADLELVQAELRASEQMVRAQVAGALESYRALLAAQPADIDALVIRATDVARIADAAYAAGGGSLLELLDARRTRAETLAAVFRWVADVRLAHLDLLRAIGASPLDSLEPR
jgi:cobalt-zinc-cadmium efflux system outer membrane protein